MAAKKPAAPKPAARKPAAKKPVAPAPIAPAPIAPAAPVAPAAPLAPVAPAGIAEGTAAPVIDNPTQAQVDTLPIDTDLPVKTGGPTAADKAEMDFELSAAEAAVKSDPNAGEPGPDSTLAEDIDDMEKRLTQGAFYFLQSPNFIEKLNKALVKGDGVTGHLMCPEDGHLVIMMRENAGSPVNVKEAKMFLAHTTPKMDCAEMATHARRHGDGEVIDTVMSPTHRVYVMMVVEHDYEG